MPKLKTVFVRDFRNVRSAELTLSADFNVFYGENGAGKTTLLEAIYLLSTGRSFRTNKHGLIINNDCDQLSVFSRIIQDNKKHEREHEQHESFEQKLGVEKFRRQKPRARLDGSDVKTSSVLAATLPLLCIEPSSFSLLEGGPSIRRTLIDWLVFHVKPSFLEAYKDYSRCLKQRNILLRSDKIEYSDLSPWDEELLKAATVLDGLRADAIRSLVKLLHQRFGPVVDALKLSFEYRSGWGDKLQFGSGDDFGIVGEEGTQDLSSANYREMLERSFARDVALGRTNLGSHRFDLAVSASGKPSTDVLSRGQKKKLIICFYLAVAHLFKEAKNKSPVLLLDDLPSEIDQDTQAWLLRAVKELGAQTFISSLERDPLEKTIVKIGNNDAGWFHVKHGVVTEEQ